MDDAHYYQHKQPTPKEEKLFDVLRKSQGHLAPRGGGGGNSSEASMVNGQQQPWDPIERPEMPSGESMPSVPASS